MKTSPVLLAIILLATPLVVTPQSIEFTNIPPAGEGGNIEGIITGVDNPENYKLALIIDVFGSLWSKPTFARPWITIRPDGTFSGNFITGGQDLCARSVHAFLVPIDYEVPTVGGGSQFPPDLVSTALAYAEAERVSTGTFEWSGYTWKLKDTGGCIWGPGPNHFSKDCVAVDSQGRLHLTIRFIGGAWRCPEIISTESFGYGIYDFYMDSNQSTFPGQIVLGKFTYDDNPAYAHREIDLEYSNGAVVGLPEPRQFVIQPYTERDQRYRYADPEGMVKSMHSFIWIPSKVSFASYNGHPVFSAGLHPIFEVLQLAAPGGVWMDVLAVIDTTPPFSHVVYERDDEGWNLSQYFGARLKTVSRRADIEPYQSWGTSSGVPPIGNEKVHINLWLFEGTAPGPENEEYTVVISRFEFTPLSGDVLKPFQPKLKISDVVSTYDPPRTKLKLELTVPAPAE